MPGRRAPGPLGADPLDDALHGALRQPGFQAARTGAGLIRLRGGPAPCRILRRIMGRILCRFRAGTVFCRHFATLALPV
ncbi:MAG: hypothetical protein U5N10_10800 [Gemmobacter sp.]|nr:hypothetical protein [Gemmobacter sp.]